MGVHLDELTLAGEPDSVPRARRFTTRTLADGPFADRADDAAMVVTELVTNALLHAGAPVTVRIHTGGDLLRIEIQDPAPELPVRSVPLADSMTGRGLTVVDALVTTWGAEPTDGGKVVWCELDADPEAAGPASDPGSHDYEPLLDDRVLHTVDIGDAPTDLLLASRARIDNVVRELTLISAGAESGRAAVQPQRLQQMTETVLYGFEEGRAAVKRLALASADSGAARTRLRLALSESAVSNAEAYLAALDEVDAYARAGHLLTLETPASERVFRRWYVESLVSQVRAAAKGETPPRVQTLEERLLEEIVSVAAAQRAAERTARLQRITAALGSALSEEDVARVVVGEGLASMYASAGAVMVPGPDRGLHMLSPVGYPAALADWLRTEGLSAQLPAADAMRSGEPVWVRSLQERDERYPRLAALEPDTSSTCALPLVVEGRAVGALRFSFQEPQVFDEDERDFLVALAGQTARAFERTALHRAEREARAAAEALASRLEHLQQVTNQMAAAGDVDAVADIIVTQLADALGAQVTSLALVEESDLRLLRISGVDDAARERWSRFPLDADLPACEAVRTGEVVMADGSRLSARYSLIADHENRGGSLICLPLSVANRRIGVVTLSFPDPADRIEPGELRFLVTLAGTCAQALDRARALQQARDATERLALLAEASAELADSRSYRDTLRSIARVVVPRLADWCSITVLENGVLQPVTVAHVDPEKVAWARALQERYPPDPDAPHGVASVIRTGTSELYPEITPEIVAAAARDEEHLRLIQKVQFSSALIVPLSGRSGTFGAVQLVYAESGRRYSHADQALLEDLARRAAVAVENARAYESQQARLASISRVAEVAQHAILAPVPTQCGPTQLAGAYVSASRDALIGGDHYEVVTRGDVVRMMIGDVRGKGLDAVRLATVVLGLFRAAAADHDDLADVARQMDRRVRPYLGDEDFVTALLLDVGPDGECRLVSCGHPPPLLRLDGELSLAECVPTVPLGLGAEPAVQTLPLSEHDRVLLYTDGLIESRDTSTGEFLELEQVAEPLRHGELGGVLGNIMARVQDAAGQRLSDDLAMLVVEYAPE